MPRQKCATRQRVSAELDVKRRVDCEHNGLAGGCKGNRTYGFGVLAR